jgi:HEAT repeat protein
MGWLKNRKLSSKDYLTRYKAVLDLGYSDDPSAVEPLLSMLDDEESLVREGAAEALGKLRSSRATTPLIELLSDPDDSVKSAAAKALGEINDPAAVEPIIDLLFNASDMDQWAYKNALDAIDRDWKKTRAARRMIQALTEELSDPDESVRLPILYRLTGMADSRATGALLKLLDDPNPEIGSRALHILFEVGDERALEPMLDLVNSDDSSSQGSAVIALGRIGDERAIRPVIEYICANKHEDQEAWNNPNAVYGVQESATKPVKALEAILERSADRASKADLKAVLRLEDYTFNFCINYDSSAYGDGTDDYTIKMDFSRARALAEQALR